MKTTKKFSLLLIGLSINLTVAADEWTTYAKDSSIYTLAMDSSHHVWYGSMNNYISKFDGSAWTVDTMLTCRYFGFSFTDKSGNIWMPTNNGGVYKYDGTTWINYNSSNSGLTNNNLYGGMEDKDGNIWLTSNSTSGGVFKYDGTTWKNYTTSDGLVGNSTFSVVQDSIGNMWFGTTSGVSKYDGSTWTNYTTSDGLVSNKGYYMYVDKSGNLWVSSNGNGISKYDGATWTTYTTTNSQLISNNVEMIFQDKKSNMWFLSNDNGISKFDGSVWTSFTTDDGLIDNAVFCGLQDPITGDIWLGTNKGISKLTLFSLSTDSLNFNSTDNLKNFDIDTYKDWTILASSWLTLSIESGSGNETVTVTADENTQASERTGAIVLIGNGVTPQTIIVTQAAGTPQSVLSTETKEKISLYPNPTTDYFQINGLDGTANLTVSDINGKLLITKIINNNESISVSNLQKGVYVIKLIDANGIVTQKLIKQ